MNSTSLRGKAAHLDAQGQQHISGGRLRTAVECFEEALRLDPGAGLVWARLAKLRAAMNEIDAAELALERACALRPNDSIVQLLAATIWREQNKPREAVAACQRARSLDPDNLEAAVAYALMLPQIYEDSQDLRRWRERFTSGLEFLHSELPRWRIVPEKVFSLEWHNFLLAYQGGDDRALQIRYSQFLSAMIDAARPEFRTAPLPTKREGDRRIRVGFVSSMFYTSTVGDYFLRWVTDLPRDRFHVSTFHTGRVVDERTVEYQRKSDRFSHLGGRSDSIAAAVRQSVLDIVILPDVGFSADSNILANVRMAPLQCAAWGHPVTTGSDATRFFLSSQAMEPADSALHYSEKLVTLPGIGVNYQRPPEFEPMARSSLGLSDEQHLYICPQSLQKVHPDSDALFLEILARDERAILLFFGGVSQRQTRTLAERLQRGMTARGIAPRRQIKFLPRTNRLGFLKVIGFADVMIDALHWSGGNTTLDALAAGLPVVTLEGRFMRGRQSAAMLRIIGVDELVAGDAEEYVELALRAGCNRDFRVSLSERIKAGLPKLFNREEPIAALADRLEEMYAVATAKS